MSPPFVRLSLTEAVAIKALADASKHIASAIGDLSEHGAGPRRLRHTLASSAINQAWSCLGTANNNITTARKRARKGGST